MTKQLTLDGGELLKRCYKCREAFPLSGFHKNRNNKDGHGTACKKCAIEASAKWQKDFRENANARSAEWKKRHVEQVKKASRKHYLEKVKTLPPEIRAANTRRWHLGKYGLTNENYEGILKSQGGGCAICGSSEAGRGKRLPVDHCHRTGKTRGILCLHCNTSLHRLETHSDWTEKALAYLRKFND